MMKYVIIQLADETPDSDFQDIADEVFEHFYAAGTTVFADRIPRPVAVFKTETDIFDVALDEHAVFNTPMPEEM